MNKKQRKVPVFLVYAGIIHAIGLALLMPMLITLPGPSDDIAPKSAAVDVELVPDSPSAAKVGQDTEQTSALPAAQPSAAEDVPVETPLEAGGSEAEAEPETDAPGPVANVSPEAQPEADATPAAETEAAGPAPAAAEAVEKPAAQRSKTAKPAAQRSRTAKPVVRRAAKKRFKIAPFNGALSGLFSPGAPANRRR